MLIIIQVVCLVVSITAALFFVSGSEKLSLRLLNLAAAVIFMAAAIWLTLGGGQ